MVLPVFSGFLLVLYVLSLNIQLQTNLRTYELASVCGVPWYLGVGPRFGVLENAWAPHMTSICEEEDPRKAQGRKNLRANIGPSNPQQQTETAQNKGSAEDNNY